jgi:hypothetical protein
MTKQTFVYIVHARRWGSDQTHNYIVGVYSNVKAAIKVAEREEEQRGGKYACDVMEWGVAESADGFSGMGLPREGKCADPAVLSQVLEEMLLKAAHSRHSHGETT